MVGCLSGAGIQVLHGCRSGLRCRGDGLGVKVPANEAANPLRGPRLPNQAIRPEGTSLGPELALSLREERKGGEPNVPRSPHGPLRATGRNPRGLPLGGGPLGEREIPREWGNSLKTLFPNFVIMRCFLADSRSGVENSGNPTGSRETPPCVPGGKKFLPGVVVYLPARPPGGVFSPPRGGS